MSISVLILTLNEASNLPECLASVAWSDDVVVVDSGSSDGTQDLARAAGARVIHHPFTNFAEQRNFGVAGGNLKNEWVLHLDADERVTPDLKTEMISAISHTEKEAFKIASKMFFRGCWLRHAALYPVYQVRLGRRESLRFVQAGHGQRENLPPQKLGSLNSALIHHSFSKGMADWFEKHNRYSTAEAAQSMSGSPRPGVWRVALFSVDPLLRRRALKQASLALPFRPALKFFYMYLLRMGFLDGVAGYHYCCLQAVYEYMIVLKTQEKNRLKQGKLL